jgi:hypothetical protein
MQAIYQVSNSYKNFFWFCGLPSKIKNVLRFRSQWQRTFIRLWAGNKREMEIVNGIGSTDL